MGTRGFVPSEANSFALDSLEDPPACFLFAASINKSGRRLCDARQAASVGRRKVVPLCVLPIDPAHCGPRSLSLNPPLPSPPPSPPSSSSLLLLSPLSLLSSLSSSSPLSASLPSSSFLLHSLSSPAPSLLARCFGGSFAPACIAAHAASLGRRPPLAGDSAPHAAANRCCNSPAAALTRKPPPQSAGVAGPSPNRRLGRFACAGGHAAGSHGEASPANRRRPLRRDGHGKPARIRARAPAVGSARVSGGPAGSGPGRALLRDFK